MLSMSGYTTPRCEGRSEYDEKKSRFIGVCRQVKSEAEANELIISEKKRYPDARHHVFAYVIENGPFRYSDDGEPQGTAGQPILAEINGRGLSNCCIVVTRYFGGTLLGRGGLTRAYSAAAAQAAASAGVALYAKFCLFAVTAEYGFYEPLTKLVGAAGGRVKKSEFEAEVRLEAAIPVTECEHFAAAVTELTNGRTSAEKGECFFDLIEESDIN